MSEAAEALASESDSQDYTHEAVPLSERRGAVTMGLLWITMVTCFPGILAGFQWYGAKFTFLQVLQGSLISCFLVLIYALPACYLGAKTGLTYAQPLCFRAMGRSFCHHEHTLDLYLLVCA